MYNTVAFKLVYSQCCCVRWNDAFSAFFSMEAGVRQGGLLSPILFSVYIDNLTKMFQQANLGCRVGLNYVGCIVYADDIVLLSQSVSCMQKMLNICDLYATEFDVKFNSSKSVALKIGPRYLATCASLSLCNKALCYVTEVKYLGMTIVTKRNFTVILTRLRNFFIVLLMQFTVRVNIQ